MVDDNLVNECAVSKLQKNSNRIIAYLSIEILLLDGIRRQ